MTYLRLPASFILKNMFSSWNGILLELVLKFFYSIWMLFAFCWQIHMSKINVWWCETKLLHSGVPVFDTPKFTCHIKGLRRSKVMRWAVKENKQVTKVSKITFSFYSFCLGKNFVRSCCFQRHKRQIWAPVRDGFQQRSFAWARHIVRDLDSNWLRKGSSC